MISLDQIRTLTKQFNVAESVVAREYFQILFLNELYAQPFSKNIFFKGGTSIRLLYGGQRFSEDLDFTVQIDETEFKKQSRSFFDHLTHTYPIFIKEKKSLTGRSYLLTAKLERFTTDIYIKLDFSFRENALEPIRNILRSEYPIITSNFIFSLSKNEIIAEKIRAILKRNKLRDLYDLWVLHQLGGKIDQSLLNQKLAYYGETFSKEAFLIRLDSFQASEFIKDLRPFVPFSERARLAELFLFIVEYLKKTIS